MDLCVPNLRQIVIELVQQIPRGKITTFRALALALGDVKASRAIGRIVSEYAADGAFPAHRIVYSDGRINSTADAGGRLSSEQLLRKEGVRVNGWVAQNFSHYLFDDFYSDHPLVKLRKEQILIAERVRCVPPKKPFRTAGGVDLSYRNDWRGVAAYVQLEVKNQKVLSIETAEQEINFPYIPTYLAFRELPVLLDLLQKAKSNRKLADVIFVDGSGILHPRHVGIASHLGVLLDMPTIGVTKTKLYGEVPIRGMGLKEVRQIIDPENGKTIGAAIKTRENSEPIYVSIGHKIDLESAVELVLQLSTKKLPEPIHLAHYASKKAAHSKSEAHQKTLDL